MTSVFTEIYRKNLWGAASRSGLGSTPEYTTHVRTALSHFLWKYNPQTLLDLPCGDGRWMQDAIRGFDVLYFGGDIVPDIVEENRRRWPMPRWEVLDVCTSALPRSDLIFCRDCLVHFPLSSVLQALRNIRRSNSKHLVTTTFPQIPEGNRDIQVGGWRRLDLTASPFNLPQPLELVNECHQGPSGPGDKSLGVWNLRSLECLG